MAGPMARAAEFLALAAVIAALVFCSALFVSKKPGGLTCIKCEWGHLRQNSERVKNALVERDSPVALSSPGKCS
jgi:hypothetical protein